MYVLCQTLPGNSTLSVHFVGQHKMKMSIWILVSQKRSKYIQNVIHTTVMYKVKKIFFYLLFLVYFWTKIKTVADHFLSPNKQQSEMNRTFSLLPMGKQLLGIFWVGEGGGGMNSWKQQFNVDSLSELMTLKYAMDKVNYISHIGKHE